jgi:hypothetical protein
MQYIANIYTHYVANVIDMRFISNVIGVLIGIYIFKISHRVMQVVMARRDEMARRKE